MNLSEKRFNFGSALSKLAGEILKREKMNEEAIIGNSLIDQEAQKQIKAKALIQKLKEYNFLTDVNEAWKSITDRKVIGATADTGSLIRTRRIIDILEKEGWTVEDKWPTSTIIYIPFNL